MEANTFSERANSLAQDLGLSLPEEACSRLQRFMALLREAPPGLIGFSPELIFREVVADTLHLARHLPPHALSAIDIGTGAGIPGIPLLCLRPDLRLTLLDSHARRIHFAHRALGNLGLEAHCVHARAETFGRGEGRGKFDAAFARAVKPLPVVIEYALPLLKTGGRFYAQQGRAFEAPTLQSLQLLGGKLLGTIPYALEPGKRRHLLIFEKIAPTSARYPRRPGVAQKRPLGRSTRF